MITAEPNQRQVRYPAIVSSWDGAGSRYVSCRARSSICCAKTALAAGLSPAICADAIDGWRPREHDLDAVRPHAGELVKLPDRREVPLAHDADAIADVLDL